MQAQNLPDKILATLLCCTLVLACKPKRHGGLSELSQQQGGLPAQVLRLSQSYQHERGPGFLIDPNYADLDSIVFKLNAMGEANLASILRDPGILSMFGNIYGSTGLRLYDESASQKTFQFLVIGMIGAYVGFGLDHFLRSQSAKKADQTAKSQLERSYQALSDERKKNTSLKDRLSDKALSFSRLEESYADAQKNFNQAISELEKLSEELGQTKAQKQRIEGLLANAQKSLEQSESHTRQVEKSLGKAQGDIEETLSKNAEIKAQVSSLQEALANSYHAEATQQDRLNKALGELKNLQKESDQLRSELEAETKRAVVAESLNEQLGTRISGLEKEVLSAQKVSESLQEQLNRAYQSMDAVQVALGGLDEDLEKVGRSAGDIQGIQEQLVRDIATIRDRVSEEVALDNEQLRKEVFRWRDSLTEALTLGEKLQTQIHSLQVDVDEAKKSEKKLQSLLTEEQKKLNSAIIYAQTLQTKIEQIQLNGCVQVVMPKIRSFFLKFS